MANVPRLPFLTKVAQIFQMAGFSDQEVWEGSPEVFTVISHFQHEIRASERYTDTPIRVFMPNMPAFEGVECRDYQVDKSWPISKVLRIILKKFNISQEDAANYLLVSSRDHPLDSDRCLADYGLGSLFRSWQIKLTTKADMDALSASRKTEAMDAKRAHLRKLKESSAESKSSSSSSKSKNSKRPTSSSHKSSSSKSSKGEKTDKTEKSSKSSKSSEATDHSSTKDRPTKSSSTHSPSASPKEEGMLAELAQSASSLVVSDDLISSPPHSSANEHSKSSSSSSSGELKVPLLDLKGSSESLKFDKLSPRAEGRRSKSNTSGARIRSTSSAASKSVVEVPPEGASGEFSDSASSPEPGAHSDKPHSSKHDSKSDSHNKEESKEASGSSGKVHSRNTSTQTLTKKSSSSSMSVSTSSSNVSDLTPVAVSQDSKEEDGKLVESSTSKDSPSPSLSSSGKDAATSPSQKSEKSAKKRSKGDSSSVSAKLKSKRSSSSKSTSQSVASSDSSSTQDYSSSSTTSDASQQLHASLASALTATALLDSLTLRPKLRSVPILLLLQQSELFRTERVRAVKWSVTMTVKKLISALLERSGHLSQAGQFVLCDLYGRALHPLATLETYGLDAKLGKWELILVRRPDAREVALLESQPLASTYAWIENKDVLPRLQLEEAKRIIIELDEKLHSNLSRDIVSQYDSKVAEVETLKSEISALKESERTLTQMFGAAQESEASASGSVKASPRFSAERLTEEIKMNKKVTTEAIKAFEEAQTAKLSLQRDLDSERASRQLDLNKLSQSHATEIAQLSEYSDALFAKNTELVSEMEELRNDMFDQRQRAKLTEREKDMAREEINALTTQMKVQQQLAELEKAQMQEQVRLLALQLAQLREKSATTTAFNTPRTPNALNINAIGTWMNATVPGYSASYDSTPYQRTPRVVENGDMNAEDVVSEVDLTKVRGVIELKDGNVEVAIDLNNLGSPSSQASELFSITLTHADDSKDETLAASAQAESGEEGNESVLSSSNNNSNNSTTSEQGTAPSSSREALDSTASTPRHGLAKVSAAPPPPPPPPPAPPGPLIAVFTAISSSSSTSRALNPISPRSGEASTSDASSSLVFGLSLLDQISDLKSRLKQTPERVAPTPSQRNQVMRAIQEFQKTALKKAAPIEKQVQEPEGLAKALYKRFVAMTDLMDVETLDDDEDDDWGTSTSDTRSTSTAAVDEDDLDEDSDVDSDEDNEDDTDSVSHSRSSSRVGYEDADDSSDSEDN